MKIANLDFNSRSEEITLKPGTEVSLYMVYSTDGRGDQVTILDDQKNKRIYRSFFHFHGDLYFFIYEKRAQQTPPTSSSKLFLAGKSVLHRSAFTDYTIERKGP